ncbi:SMI1/KNR4 family protein [Acinetobacter sp. LF10]|uniref:SMI1/KNR4 family protein n=1 Tax=Acinetobacter sp. LF10 TaxID=3403576 RepID=UPI003B2278F5
MKVYEDNGRNSLDEIHRVQSELGYNLPKNYISLMQKHDALEPIENIFDFTNVYDQADNRDINFFSFKENYLGGSILSEQENVSDLNNYGIENLVVFGRCANGDYICFDYRDNPKSSEPKIVLVYHDDFIDYDDGKSTMVVNFVADNFDEFMKSLYESEE